MTLYYERFPAEFGPKSVSFELRGQTVAGPVSLTGRTQVAMLGYPYWVATLEGLTAGGPAAVLAYRRLRGLMAGGAGAIAVPVFDVYQAPWPVAGVYSAAATKFSDGTGFSDGTAFYTPVIKIMVGAAASAGATSISVSVTTAGTRYGGEYFSINARLYQIVRVEDDGTWTITPPLREDITTADRIDMDRPVSIMRLVDEGAADLNLAMGRYGFPAANFVEVIE